MNHVDRLMRMYQERATACATARIDVLLDLERLDDPRVGSFLLEVLTNRREPVEVRNHVLKRLRHGGFVASLRPLIAEAMLLVSTDRAFPRLRVEAALALGELTDVARVVRALGDLALDASLPVDLRYSAFTSLQRAGPTAECVALLRTLTMDETLGRSAQRELASWRMT